jgi:hypothetical protein
MWYYRGDFGRAWLFDLTFRTLGSEEVSKLIADHLVPITLVVIGSYLFWASIRPQLANHDFYRHLPTVDHLNPFNQTISLRDAANRLYDELRGTDVGESFDSHSAATSDEILDGVAHHIMEHVPARTADAFRFVLARHAGEIVVLVGHDSVNRVLLLQLLDQAISHYWRIEQEPCCINEIDLSGARTRVLRINETAHLASIL